MISSGPRTALSFGSSECVVSEGLVGSVGFGFGSGFGSGFGLLSSWGAGDCSGSSEPSVAVGVDGCKVSVVAGSG